jgi:erythromycin 3''-O-methyltransferase
VSPSAVAAPEVAAPTHLDLPLLNEGGPTQWANLGDWSTATTYPDAARALAVRLGTAAGLHPGQRIADVGVGAGEQLLVWLTQFGVQHISASDRSAALVAAATRRVVAAGHGAGATVVAAAASALTLPPQSVDRVLALDAAYHFADRPGFFRRAAAALRPSGRLALTDLVSETPPTRTLRAMARLSGIPVANLLTTAAYTGVLERAGFTDVRTEDLTTAVLAGFARWARAQRWSHVRRAQFAVPLTGVMAESLVRDGQVRYVLVTASVVAR